MNGNLIENQEAQDLIYLLNAFLSIYPPTKPLSLQETIAAVEKLDDGPFVKRLKSQIQLFAEPIINGKDVNLSAHEWVEIIMSDPEYVELYKRMISTTKKSITESIMILGRNTANINEILSGGNIALETSAKSDSTHNSSQIGSLSFGNDPVEDDITLIIQQLAPGNNFDARFAAIQKLASFASGDLLSEELWQFSKKAMQMSLEDSDTRIALIGLKVYARSFSGSPIHMVSEVYFSFIQTMDQKLLKQTEHIRNYFNGLNMADSNVILNLKMFRLLIQMIKEWPSFWCRLSLTITQQIMRETISFFLKSYDGLNIPFCLMAIIDPFASWFEKWFISSFGRNALVPVLIETDSLAKMACLCLSQIDIFISKKHEISKQYNEMIIQTDIYFSVIASTLVIFGRMLVYKLGRSCFPIQCKKVSFDCSWISRSFIKSDGNVILTLDGLIFLLMTLMTNYHNLGLRISKHQDTNLPVTIGQVAVSILRDASVSDLENRQLLYTRDVLEFLSKPIESCIRNHTEYVSSLPFIAETLSNMVANETGRKFIIESACSIDIISLVATFVTACLNKNLQNRIPLTTVALFVYFLRQLYGNADGLERLISFDIDQSLIKSLSEADPKWKIEVIDNLLHFAGTPKGCLILNKSGKILECVEHMYNRYRKKLQVSRCEKFGYGVLVSQISTTRLGMEALYSSGLFTSYIRQLWYMLDGHSPFEVHHISKENHAIAKIVNYILKVLLSYDALETVIGYEEKQNYNEKLSFHHLIENLVLLDKPGRSESLMHYYESHHTGLTILKTLCGSLDCCLILQEKFKFQESLIKQQEECVVWDEFDNCNYIIDENVILRNYILISTCTIGGPSERKLPSSDSIDEPLVFFSPELPASILPCIDEMKYNEMNERHLEFKDILDRGLTLGIDSNSKEWLNELQNAFRLCIIEHKRIPISLCREFLKKILKIFRNLKLFQKSQSKDSINSETLELSSIENSGCELIIKYGNRMFPSACLDVEILRDILLKNHTNNSSMDWFIGIIYLFMQDSESTLEFLADLKTLEGYDMLWITEQMLVTNCHLIETIAEQEMLLTSFFTQNGITIGQITKQWLKECWLNILDIEEIGHFLIMGILMGMENVIYMTVAIIRNSISEWMASGNLIRVFRNMPKDGFKIADHLEAIDALAHKYQSTRTTEIEIGAPETHTTAAYNGNKILSCLFSDSYRILVVDSSTLALLNSCLKYQEILLQNITEIEQVSYNRKSHPDLSAIYFLSPSPDSIQSFIKDWSSTPIYSSAYLHFTSTIPEALFQEIKASPASRYIKALQELHLDFLPFESRVFTLDLPLSLFSLYSPRSNSYLDYDLELISRKLTNVLVTLGEYPYIRYFNSGISDVLAKKLQNSIDSLSRSDSSYPSDTNEQGILLILDRKIDLVSPAIHEFSYQAMIADLLKIKSRHKYSENNETKEAVLDESDIIWKDIRHLHIAKAIEYLKKVNDELAASEAGKFTKSNTSSDQLAHLKGVVSSLPRFQELKPKSDIHTNICVDALKYYSETFLEDVSGFEQNLVMADLFNTKIVKKLYGELIQLLNNDNIERKDKIRLVLLYVTATPGTTDSERQTLFEKAQFGVEEAQMISNLGILGVKMSTRSEINTDSNAYSLKKLSARSPKTFEFENSKFTPALYYVIKDLLQKQLDSNIFAWLKEPPVGERSTKDHSTGTPSTTRTKPTWATKKSMIQNIQVKSLDSKSEPLISGPKIIIFILGGMTLSESRAIYQLSKEFNRDIIIGSTHIWNPEEYMTNLMDLHHSGPRNRSKNPFGNSKSSFKPITPNISTTSPSTTNPFLKNENSESRRIVASAPSLDQNRFRANDNSSRRTNIPNLAYKQESNSGGSRSSPIEYEKNISSSTRRQLPNPSGSRTGLGSPSNIPSRNGNIVPPISQRNFSNENERGKSISTPQIENRTHKSRTSEDSAGRDSNEKGDRNWWFKRRS